jgi:hypothetical protein
MLRIELAEALTTIELLGVYDGWSIAVMRDGGWLNRWSNDEGTGPEPGYERRWRAAQTYIEINAQTQKNRPSQEE